MKSIDDILVIVQARLSSQRCPKKMLKPFGNTTLMDICIQKILDSQVIPKENFYVSVHEKELVDVVEKYGVNIFHRSEKSAKSEGEVLTEIYEWHDKLPFKYVIMVSACNPFLSIETIDQFVKDYMTSESDGMFGVVKRKNYFWNMEGKLLVEWPKTRDCLDTKVVGNTLEAAHCLYAGTTEKISKGVWMGDFRIPDDIELYTIQNEFETLDIDYEWQFDMAAALYKSANKTRY